MMPEGEERRRWGGDGGGGGGGVERDTAQSPRSRASASCPRPEETSETVGRSLEGAEELCSCWKWTIDDGIRRRPPLSW